MTTRESPLDDFSGVLMQSTISDHRGELGALASLVEIDEGDDRSEGARHEGSAKRPSRHADVDGDRTALIEASSLSVAEIVCSAHQGEARPEHIGIERRGDLAGRLAPLYIAADGLESCGEPSNDVESIKDMGGVAETRLHRSSIGLGAVCHHNLYSPAPTVALAIEKALNRLGISMRNW